MQPLLKAIEIRTGEAWTAGVEEHDLDGTQVRIYSRAKSIADAFKYRHKLGLDVALEALDLYRKGPDFDIRQLLHYADICRVKTVMQPYLEALL